MRKNTIYFHVIGLTGAMIVAIVSAGLVVSAQNSNSSMTTEQEPRVRRTGRCDPTQQEQTDLSGTYTGRVNYPDGGLTGEATLTITGNNFTLAAGSATQSGRITAVTTCNYTGATMMFGEITTPAPGATPPPPLPAVSVRVRRSGDRISIASVPGEKRAFSFNSGGATRPRRQRTTPSDAPAMPSPTPE